MKLTKAMITMVALTATAVRAGDSAPFLLDTTEGTRIAGEVETITYSPHWNGAASCTVTETGKSMLVADATEAGEIAWTPQGEGVHTLTHTAGDLTYTAQFAVLGDDVVVHSGTITANEVWKSNKVHLVTAPVIVGDDYDFSYFCELEIQAGAIVKFMPGSGISIKSNAYCRASGAIFTHVNDDTIGGDTLMDGDETVPVMNEYDVPNMLVWDDEIEFRYFSDPKVTLSGTISADEIWRGHNIYCVTGNLTVASGKTLTIMPGAIVKFAAGLSLTVNGTLNAQGTRAQPIVFTSLKDDEHGGDANGDGEKTYPYAGDWYQIRVAGTANFNYCHVLYNSSTENYGAVEAYGGTVNFDNSEIAHAKYECVNAHSSGNFTARNSVFRDSSLGFGYYGSGRVKAYNCVFADLSVAVRQSGKTLTNCAFYRCLAFTDQSGDGSTYSHCVFFNPAGYGAQSYSKCGSNGNIWGDPKFEDPDNVDIGAAFRIAANSPCVDAGDAANAPEYDYYGQPRDDGAPDIGICELAGGMSANDLAAVAVSSTGGSPVQGDGNAQAARSTIGDTITISYTVANVGREAVADPWHDALYLVSSTSGKQYALGEPLNPGGIGAGETRTFTYQFALPVVPVGQYRLRLVVNSRRMDVPEGAATKNNALVSEGEIEVVADSIDATDGVSGSVAVGASSVCAFTLPTGSGDRLMRVTSSAGGATLSARCGLGFLPVNADAGTALSFSGGAAWISVPAGTEKVWLVLDNGGTAAAPYEVEFIDGSLTLSGISPASIPSSGNVTVEIAGAGFTDACEVSFIGAGTVAPLSVKRVSQGLLSATVDAGAFASGKTYSVAVRKGTETKTLQDALSVAAAPGKPKFWAKLDVPSSMRQGRLVETCFIEYGNSGTADMLSPVLQVSMTGDGTLGYIGGLSGMKTLQFIAAGDAGSAGVLRPGSSHRIRFAIRAGASNKISLHTSEGSNYAPAPWTNAADYLADLSAAATRIDLRGQDATDYENNLSLAVSNRTGSVVSAIFGKIVNDYGLPVGGATIRAENGSNTNFWHAVSDASGVYEIGFLADGMYVVSICGGGVTETDMAVEVKGEDVKCDFAVCDETRAIVRVENADSSVKVSATPILGGKTFFSESVDFGVFEFKGLTNGIYRVDARSSDMSGSCMIQVADGKVVEGLVSLVGTCSISGTVAGFVDGDVPLVVVSSGENTYTVAVNAGGVFSLNGIPAGEYCFLHVSGSVIASADVAPVEIEAGETAMVEVERNGMVAVKTMRTTSVLRSNSTDEEDIKWYQTARGVASGLVAEGKALWESGIANRPEAPSGDYDCEHNRKKFEKDKNALQTFTTEYINFEQAYNLTDTTWLWVANASRTVGFLADVVGGAYLKVKKALAVRKLRAVQKALANLEFATVELANDVVIMEMKSAVGAAPGLAESIDIASDSAEIGSQLSRLAQYADQIERGCKKVRSTYKTTKALAFVSTGLEAVSYVLSVKEAWDVGRGLGETAAQEVFSADSLRSKMPRFRRILAEYRNVFANFNNYPLCCTQCYPENPYDPPVDNKTPNIPKSCDPNEMVGEEGVGDARYVKPGQELTYTIYFENKAGFDIADAQEVKVTNPLSEWLDWSTFEMREVAFNNQCDVNLDRLANGTSEVQMNGTNKYVRTTVECDVAAGVASWYMRVYDPNGDSEGYPLDGSGFLPSNDDTHRGEGHITYRIKVRENAPANVVITNSATIVFDHNDPIETDPAWWNTVAGLANVTIGDGEDAITTQLIVGMPYGDALPGAPANAMPGYTFGGWYTGPNGTGRRVTAQSLVQAGDGKLYAHWLAHAYIVRFNANGGTGQMNDQAFEFDKPGPLDANAFTRKDHAFDGWATSASGSVVYADGAEVKNLTDVDGGVVELFAVWKVVPQSEPGPGPQSEAQPGQEPQPVPTVPQQVWTVTFNANGGAGSMAAQTFTNGVAQALNENAFTRFGYYFAGWATSADGEVAYADGQRIAVSSGQTLYAQWTEIVAERLNVSFAKAQTVLGALYGKDGVPVGTVQVKVGKINKKKGTVKISATATVLVGGKAKKVTAKAVDVAATSAAAPAKVAFKAPIGEMAFEMEADGTFTLKNASYVMAEKKVGGKWTRAGARVWVAATSAAAPAAAGTAAPHTALPPGTIEELLPDGEPVIPKAGKWSFAKATGVKWAKPKKGAGRPEIFDEKSGKGLIVDKSKGKTNLSGLKLTYTPKTGIFTGSFNIYAIQGGKLKKVVVKVIGVVVDGKGWGRASGPGGVSFAVTVE